MFQTVLLAGLAVVGTLIATTRAVFAQSSESALRIEAKIPLGDVRGRIDHMAFDLARQRLFVAELGNVERVDVLPFHQMGKFKWEKLKMDYVLRDAQSPSAETTKNVVERFRAKGLNAC